MKNDDWRVSAAGLATIAEFEGFEPQLYDCAAGHCTIGYGHVVHFGRTGHDTEAESGFRGGISEVHAKELLLADVGIAEAAVRRRVTVPLSQPHFDALVSFVFNVGETNFAESTLLRLVNDEKFGLAAAQFDRWVMAGKHPVEGLRRRRRQERAMFERGGKAA